MPKLCPVCNSSFDGRFKSCPECARTKEELDTDKLLEELENSLVAEDEEELIYQSPVKNTAEVSTKLAGELEAAKIQEEKAAMEKKKHNTHPPAPMWRAVELPLVWHLYNICQ